MIKVKTAEGLAVQARLVKLVSGILGADLPTGHAFPVEQQLSELGLSSLKMVHLMLAVEVEFDIAIPPSDITPQNFHSVMTMQAMVEQILKSA